MTTIGLSYSLVKISTKCAPALVVEGPALRVTLPCVIHITMLREFHRHGNPFN